ncbi:hypothetical protein C2S51_017892 [Perilla frutescens var. frutescens]|nr:hypothetical protein C2S51_017892 [Perilla frutescens var. frutescens]
MPDLIRALQGFIQQQTQAVMNNQNAAPNAPAPPTTNQVIEQFRRYTPPRFNARLLDTEDQKADWFMKGLRPEIRGILAAQGITDYSQVVKQAHEVATGLEVDKAPPRNTDHHGKRKWDNQNKENENFPIKRDKPEARPTNRIPTGIPPCPECKKTHFGPCLWRKGVCYNCQEPGHMATNCPKKRREEPKKGGNARLFTFTQQEAGEKRGTMSGMISVSGMPVLALFDSSTSHSFISIELRTKLGLYLEIENLALDVRIPSGKTLRTDRISKDIRLDLEGKELAVGTGESGTFELRCRAALSRGCVGFRLLQNWRHQSGSSCVESSWQP